MEITNKEVIIILESLSFRANKDDSVYGELWTEHQELIVKLCKEYNIKDTF